MFVKMRARFAIGLGKVQHMHWGESIKCMIDFEEHSLNEIVSLLFHTYWGTQSDETSNRAPPLDNCIFNDLVKCL